jgi:hypothetical protein
MGLEKLQTEWENHVISMDQEVGMLVLLPWFAQGHSSWDMVNFGKWSGITPTEHPVSQGLALHFYRTASGGRKNDFELYLNYRPRFALDESIGIEATLKPS